MRVNAIPSRRLQLANFGARHFARPKIARTPTPEQARKDLERATRFLIAPPYTLALPGEQMDRVSVGVPDQSRVILYFHGGGYIAGSPRTHRALVARIAALTGMEVFVPRYPLAPDHPAPAAFEAGLSAFETLLSRGYRAGSIVLGGDSAGGGLALAVMAALLQRGQMPAGLFGLSPWTDLTTSGASMTANATVDRLLDPARISELVGYVTAGQMDPADPRISPLFASYSNPPPVLLQVAQTEILLDDTRRMARVLTEAGGRVIVSETEDAPHVWQLLDGLVPEARESLKEVADFIGTLA